MARRGARSMKLLCITLLAAALSGVGAQASAAGPVETRGTLVLDGVPPHSADVQRTLDAWLVGRSATFQDFLPDGSLLVTTRFADAEQLHRVRTPRGAREQLTFDAEPVGATRASPTATRTIFARDTGGNENAQFYALDPDSPHARLLTDGRSRHGSLVWSRDGQRVAFQSNARNGVNQDVYVLEGDADAASARLLVASQGQTWSPLDWSPDGTRLLILDYVSVNDARLALVDVASGAITPVMFTATPKTRSGIGSARFSANGRGIWLTADAGEEFRQLRFFDLDTQRSRSLTADTPWDVDDIAVGADGRYVAYVTNVDGYDRLTVLDLGSDRQLPVSGLPEGLITNLRFDANGKTLGMSIESSRAPRDVWTYEPERNVATRWTFSETGSIDPHGFAIAQTLRYPTWDRVNRKPRLVPALVYRPTDRANARGKWPVLIDIHGGPEGQSRPGYSAFTQYLVNALGYAVIQPNVRGSTGYGRSYTDLDNGMLREDAVRDIGSLLVWIATQPDLDAARVIVSGGSYGGYMSLATLVHYGDRLRGGIDVVGISNFVTFLNNTSSYRRDLRRAEYGDERDPKMNAFLQRISPLARARAIRKPLLVVQGLNDPRVPANESAQMVAAVRANGTEVWYLAAKDEGHGFRKKGNRDFYLKTVATFLERMRGE